MKFFNLFKKELKEMFNTNMIVSLIVSFALLMIIGQFMQSSVNNITESNTSITICDLDSTDLTSRVITELENTGYNVEQIYFTDYPDDVYISQQTDSKNILVIPQGFTQSIESGEIATIKNIGKVEGNSIMAQLESSTYTTAIYDVSSIIKNIVIQDKTNFTTTDIEFLDNLVTLDEVTIVGEKSENISASTVSSVISSQGTFVPIIIFVIIIFASQMIVTAISTEKIDKTLETLLSTPISRVSILTAKMLSAGLVSLISATVYMLGFSMSMGSIISTDSTTEVTSSAISTTIAMMSLGLVLNPLDYVLIGLNIFLSIMIALSLSMMLGVMVDDVKSTQIVMMPVMFMAMIPYLISYFADINTLSPIVKLILNLIPFTHTFNATNNLMFGNTSIVWVGIVYQLIFLIVCMFFAVRLFKSDKILTANLNFNKNKKKSVRL